MKNLLKHLVDCVKVHWNNLSRWFSYYKVLRKVYDFDYSSVLEVERHQLERLRKYVSNYEHIDLALKLLDIIQEEGCSEMHGGINFIKEGNDLYKIEDSKIYYTIPVYVNTRNYKRFWNTSKNFEDPKYGNLWKDYLRIEKAWYLFMELKKYKMRTWWGLFLLSLYFLYMKELINKKVFFDYNDSCKVGELLEIKEDYYVIKDLNNNILNIPIWQSLTKL